MRTEEMKKIMTMYRISDSEMNRMLYGGSIRKDTEFVSILVLMDLPFLPVLTFKPVFFNGFVYFLHFAFCTV